MTHRKDQSMNTTRIAAALLAGIATTAPLQAAAACEFTRTPWGLRISNCKLADFYGSRYDLKLDVDRRPPVLTLPNLVPTDVDAGVNGVGVNLAVEVQNLGDRGAVASEVVAMAGVNDPLNNGSSVGVTALGPYPVPALAIGSGVVVSMGRIFLPNRNQDWDVCTLAIVDPPTAGGSALGRIFESNESDNQWQGCCRVYGPKPDLNGPPACQ
jgi:hypothetical protein